MSMNLEALRQASEAAQAIWPYAWPIAVAALSTGWLSPFFSENQKLNVVELYRQITGRINRDKFLHHTPNIVDVAKRGILNITRGAAMHSKLLGNR